MNVIRHFDQPSRRHQYPIPRRSPSGAIAKQKRYGLRDIVRRTDAANRMEAVEAIHHILHSIFRYKGLIVS